MIKPSSHRSSTLLDRGRRHLVLLLATVLVAAGLLTVVPGPALAATHQVTGQVFRDFNSNGVKNSPTVPVPGVASDVGLGGVTVTAVDGKGVSRGTATTTANGSYTLTVVDPWSTAVRIQFSGLPAGYESSFHGSDSGTSVQFIQVGSSPVTGVDFAVNVPEDFSQGVAPLVTAMNTAGLRSHVGNVGKPSLVSVPWTAARNDTPPAGNYSARTTLATVNQTGSLWGSAFQPRTGDLFASASLRRHTELGPMGLGGIYRVVDALQTNGTISTSTAAPEAWLDVTTLGVDVGVGPTNRGLGAPSSPARDMEAIGKVGKVGIGGIAVSSDNTLLYFMNLLDKKVYAVDIATKTLVDSYDLNLAADERPWALTVHRGKVYIGYVETGQGVTPAPAPADMDMVVRAAPESSLSSLGSSSAEVLRADLGYQRGQVRTGVTDPRFAHWHTWVDAWDPDDVTFNPTNNSGSWAQASLSDLAFTTQGELVLGLQDRYTLQSGDRNFGPITTDNALYPAMSLGDTLIAGPNASGTFTLENNGSVTTVANGGTSSTRSTASGSANEGPGGKEFFEDTNVYGPERQTTSHKEITLGGLATLAGVDQVVSTAFDPVAELRNSGFTWHSTTNGDVNKGYQLSADGGDIPNANGNFAKAGGLGDIQALANLAPLEIGNRVWFDADQDGVQDADEPAIAGVEVELFAADTDGDPTGSAISSTTTDAAGEYYFDVDPDERYVVVFTPPTTGNWVTGDSRFGTVKWADMAFTGQSLGGNTVVDSNVDADGNALVETGGPGQNDHTIDAGLVANASFTAEKLIDDDGGEPATDQTFTLDFAARDFRGDALTLTQSSVTLDADETSDAFEVPVGASVKVTEADSSDYRNVTIAAPAGATQVDDYYRVQGNSPAFAFTVTNTLFEPGTFEVTKTVTGDVDLDSSLLADAEFTVHYAYAGGSGDLVLDQDNDWTIESGELPYGAVVTLSEPTISGHDPSVEFGTPTWKVDATPATTAATKQFTVGDGSSHEIALSNPSTEIFGGFDLTKQVTGDGATRVPDDFEFVAEYSLDSGTTWTALDAVTKVDSQTDGPDDIPVGTKVLIREQAPDAIVDVDWVSAAFSGTGVTPATSTVPASFVIEKNTSLAVTLTNTTEEKNGQFTITKDVTGPGEQLIPLSPDFTINWTRDGAAQPPIVLKNTEFFTSVPMPTGTEVTITEVTPTGSLPAGATWGTPVLRTGGVTHANGSTFDIGDEDALLEIVLDNSTDVEPEVEITKGDGDAPTAKIVHEADTVAEGEFYQPGETRDIVIRVDNPGPEPLREVKLTDVTRAGGDIANLSWTFPDGSTVAADWNAATSTWSATWAATYAPGTTMWEVDDVIVGTAKLTVNAPEGAHQDRVRVDAEGAYSGKKVDDENDYNSFTAAIQLIKYDGNKPDPAVKDSNGTWIVPNKPLADPMQDANDTDHSVNYVAKKDNKVRWVATNTGPTTLTRITLADVTGFGPKIGADWTSNLTAFGGPADYSFVKDGPWNGLFPPGASFFSRGTLTLPADSKHGDTVTVTGVPVVPATNPDGTPSDKPLLNGNGDPVLVLDDKGNPVVLTDDDPFHAHTPAAESAVLPRAEDEDEEAALPDAGSPTSIWGPLGAFLLVVAGAGLVLVTRRNPAPATGRHRS